jgi:NADH dehydrogenase
MTNICLPRQNLPRIVIIGGGFAGYNLVKRLSGTDYQIVLLDKNNYHQFQPLLYQVATSGLESDSISFPLRKLFHKRKNIHYRFAEVEKIETEKKQIITNQGIVDYDILVMAQGSKINYYGMDDVARYSYVLKDISDALRIRNQVLRSLEMAEITCDQKEKDEFASIVIVGGGPTGVEMAGALAEFRRYILKKDYPGVAEDLMKIYLVEMMPQLLPGLSDKASRKAEDQLKRMGVTMLTNHSVTSYNGHLVSFNNGKKVNAATLIWSAGVMGNLPLGFSNEYTAKGSRIKVDEYNQVVDHTNIYAIGDIAAMVSDANPKGHPMLAQAAMQQSKHLAKNLKRMKKNKLPKPFLFKNKGYIATVGKTYAVADFGKLFFKGFAAWIVWATVHLYAMVGGKNKFMVGINWLYHYITYDKANRHILRGFK